MTVLQIKIDERRKKAFQHMCLDADVTMSDALNVMIQSAVDAWATKGDDYRKEWLEPYRGKRGIYKDLDEIGVKGKA